MDKTEKVKYESSLLEYIEKQKLSDLIESYTK
jgi:hypothetical protein